MELSDLDRQIVGALMTTPRAPWSRIAQVLGVPERTVARRGAELLDSGVVAVVGIYTRPFPVLIAVRTAPGTSQVAARALASRVETSFVYEVTGPYDALAEILLESHEVHGELASTLPAVMGVQHVVSTPILHYYKSLREWQPSLISPAQSRALLNHPLHSPDHFGVYDPLDRHDQLIAEALLADGRVSAEAAGRLAGVSEATARRRIARLLDSSIMHVRALIDPANLGLPVEAMLWIKAPPARVLEIGRALAALPEARYVAALAGEYPILADITLPSLYDLRAFTTLAPWAHDVSMISTSLVLRAQKRGGRLATDLDHVGGRFRRLLP